jgi:transcriptional regulator with XRE-family HTH domain
MKPLYKELKDIREEKGVTLEEIYRVTKIRVPFLEKIEEGDFSVVPEPFMRAFLREYAEAVGVDPGRVISKYEGKSAAIRDEDFWKYEKNKPGGTDAPTLAGAGTSASNPPLESTPEKPTLPRKEKKAPAPLPEQPAPVARAAAKIISDVPESSGTSDRPAPGRVPALPDDEESKSPRTLLFGVFAVVIIAATLVILYLNGIIAF